MKEKLMRFMQGRYGVDALSRAMLTAGLVAVVLSLFFRNGVGGILSLIGWITVILVYVRMLSRNIRKRYGENQKYLELAGRVRNYFRRQKNTMVQRKTHHIYSCPGCKQKVRVPRGRGKIEVSCPRCHTKFIRKS